jgi:hypothetical protein
VIKNYLIGKLIIDFYCELQIFD